MQKITTEILINTSAEVIWKHIIDIERWPSWNPIIKSASGLTKVGETLSITMAGPKGKNGPKYEPVVIENVDSKCLRWRAKMGAAFLFSNDKVLILEDLGDSTKLVHSEEFRGLLAKVFCKSMEAGVPPMLNSMNEALKKMAEKSD